MGGWVYIITNKAMPGLLKVGFTTKHPEERAQQLTAAGKTGVPWPYVVEYQWWVEYPRALEQRVHAKLARVRENREWFRCAIEEALAVVEAEIPPRKRTRKPKPTPPTHPEPKKVSEVYTPQPFNTAERICLIALFVVIFGMIIIGLK
ncbi:MAG: GIY-YIG nuclease family protein [Desulfurellaceae bacterium]|nr:GIY-YIG nuclease family protein [Desulfurellaceae bacterium]